MLVCTDCVLNQTRNTDNLLIILNNIKYQGESLTLSALPQKQKFKVFFTHPHLLQNPRPRLIPATPERHLH